MISCFQFLVCRAVTALITVAWLLVAAIAHAAAEPMDKLPPPPKGSEFQLIIENDMLSGTDRYYTSGIKLGFGVPFETLRDFFKVPSKYVLDMFSDRDASHHFGLFVGQNLYTPRNISIAAPQLNDRPWAAWMYLGGVAQRVRGNRMDTVELDIGMVGPPALGEPVQSNWHKVVGSPHPAGWDNQNPSELAFLISYLQKRKYGNASFEVVPHAGVTLGTVMSLARAGGIVRVGRNMTGFGVDSIEPGGAMMQNTRREHNGAGRSHFEWSGFAGVDVRYVAYNIFLDGTVFHDSYNVDRRNVVRDFTLGASVRKEALRVSLTRIFRSEEFTTPYGGGGKQAFYSLNLGLEF